jgi:hypothetical protein
MFKLNTYDDWVQLQPVALAIKINALFKDIYDVGSCHKSSREEGALYDK